MTPHLETLIAIARDLEPDAQEVLCLIASRLRHGRAEYGDLDLDRDPREWIRELLEEQLDGCSYGAMALLKSLRTLRAKHLK